MSQWDALCQGMCLLGAPWAVPPGSCTLPVASQLWTKHQPRAGTSKGILCHSRQDRLHPPSCFALLCCEHDGLFSTLTGCPLDGEKPPNHYPLQLQEDMVRVTSVQVVVRGDVVSRDPAPHPRRAQALLIPMQHFWASEGWARGSFPGCSVREFYSCLEHLQRIDLL